jgi:NAD(P) transhydrogenase subunit alpha
MIVGGLTEATGSERRVSLVPAVVPMLQKAGHQVLAQRGAGAQAGFADDAYEATGWGSPGPCRSWVCPQVHSLPACSVSTWGWNWGNCW